MLYEVITGAAYGSRMGMLFHLNHKQIILLLGCACTGAMSAIFKAPVAAVIFALEVIMLDLTLSSLIPLLLASATALITSYLFMGQNVLYPVDLKDAFVITSYSIHYTKLYEWMLRT